MFLRRTYLESRFSLPNAGERTTDIAMKEPITNLWVEFRCLNGATSNKDVTMSDCIEAIEVIDGSDVIYALDGKEALALTAYYCNNMHNQLVTELGNTTQNLSIVIPFGRFEGDPIYAFDPTKFLNPQVRVKWNLAAIRAVGADGFTTGGLVYTLVATCMEGGSSPQAYFMSKEIYSYVSAVGVEYVDLPTDYRYKMLMVRPHYATKAIYSVVTNLMLHVNQQQFVLFNMRMTDFIRYNSWIEPQMEYDHVFQKSHADQCYHILGYADTPIHEATTGVDQTHSWQGMGIGQGPIGIWVAGAQQDTDVPVYAQVTGHCPFHCVLHNFGRRDEQGDYFDAPAFRSARLELTGGVAGGNVYVALVQERPYS